jgi:pimeloyl-ACP methyl ester carboxylesterase
METITDVGGGIALAHEELGDPGGVPLLLICGLGMQLPSWPDGFCELLTSRGYLVVRFDNRDTGRSTHLDFAPPGPLGLMRKRWDPKQYTLAAMAADTASLLDRLGIESAHVAGISMGGMIAQTLAARYPDRVRSLTSIMSTTGASRVGRPALSTWLKMFSRPARTKDDAADRAVRIFRHVGSAGYPFDESFVRELAGLAWDRDPLSAPATGRQLAAIVKSGDRTAEVARITVPALVIHGDRDRMVNPTGGAATSRAIPGARLETIKGLGHDLPRGVWPVITGLIDSHIRAAADAAQPASQPAGRPAGRPVVRGSDGQES